jgi:hypothetical protein
VVNDRPLEGGHWRTELTERRRNMA